MTERIYDIVNGGEYEKYARFVRRCFELYSDIPVNEVLDLGCGTGGITSVLAGYGYDMTALDISPEMLSVAQQKLAGKGVLLLNQDMRSFELYGTVQGIVCSFDTLNYLESAEELETVLGLCRLYLEPGGIMVFDLNSRYRYEKIYGRNSFVYEFGDDMLIWQNCYRRDKAKCDFYLTMFSECGDGYTREDETVTETFFPLGTVRKATEKAGFTDFMLFGGYDLSEAKSDSEKWYIAVKAK